jgi:hypothetical protein
MAPPEISDDTRTAVADPGPACPQPLLRAASLSNDYDPLAAARAQAGAAETHRPFARPPDARTITAQSLERRIPLGAVAVASAVVGLVAFAVVIIISSHLSSAPKAKPVATAAPAVPPAITTATPPAPSAQGPFSAARRAFATTIATPPPPPVPTSQMPPADTE